VALLESFGILETLRPNGFEFHDAATVHLALEAWRRAYADRARYLGDPAFVEIPLEMLLSRAHLVSEAHAIDPARATASSSLRPVSPTAEAGPDHQHTTHVSVADDEGNAVALTTTLNYLFGACVVAPGTGILLNDEMDDFAVAPGTPNTYGLVGSEA